MLRRQARYVVSAMEHSLGGSHQLELLESLKIFSRLAIRTYPAGKDPGCRLR